jgi:hypothetical protein
MILSSLLALFSIEHYARLTRRNIRINTYGFPAQREIFGS